ncbi:hypothetical protein, partial [uncultured Bradyrhizobium sp.]|uniref:hypothetical protein n=1 Tax=uncultured Bradyrhizobium sp. TaxID=199684 RepID=UPI003458D71C
MVKHWPGGGTGEGGRDAHYGFGKFAVYPGRNEAEHLAQHELSVHSLSYFYNWCFSHVRTRYSWKWDGDMVLTTEGEASIGDLGWQVGHVRTNVRVPRHPLYLDATGRFGYLDLGL